jgi:hypothetical protein
MSEELRIPQWVSFKMATSIRRYPESLLYAWLLP